MLVEKVTDRFLLKLLPQQIEQKEDAKNAACRWVDTKGRIVWKEWVGHIQGMRIKSQNKHLIERVNGLRGKGKLKKLWLDRISERERDEKFKEQKAKNEEVYEI